MAWADQIIYCQFEENNFQRQSVVFLKLIHIYNYFCLQKPCPINEV